MDGAANLSCVNVYSIIWMVRWGVGICGPSCLYGAPWMYMMSSLSLTRHEHGSVHGRMVWSYDWLLILPDFVNVWCLV